MPFFDLYTVNMEPLNELAIGNPQDIPVQDVRFTIFEDDNSESVLTPGIEDMDDTGNSFQ